MTLLGPLPTCGSLAFAPVLLGCSLVAQVFLQTKDPAQGWATDGIDLNLVRPSVTSEWHCPGPIVHTPGNEVCSLHSP